MRKVAAAVSIIGMLYALVYGPLFHVHSAEEGSGTPSTLHAHFADVVLTPEPAGPNFEHPHSQSSRSVDMFVSNVTSRIHQAAIAPDRVPLVTELVPGRDVVPVTALHSHDPPERLFANPRSPPTV